MLPPQAPKPSRTDLHLLTEDLPVHDAAGMGEDIC
jgi:hypothetical protein